MNDLPDEHTSQNNNNILLLSSYGDECTFNGHLSPYRQHTHTQHMNYLDAKPMHIPQ